MKRGLATFAFCLLILASLAAGCRSPRRGEALRGSLALNNDQVARGQLVFMERCYYCHPGGEGGLGPSLNDKPLPRFLMKTQVRLGLGTMPSFKSHEISAEELDDLTAYLVALRKQPDRSPH